MNLISGSCHCSNIHYELMWPDDSDDIATRECGCSFCKKHGAAWTSHTEARLHATIVVAAKVSEYQFGTRTASFHVCNTCGVVPFVVSSIGNAIYAVVNANTLDDQTRFTFSASTADFDGEETDARLARRKKNWINQVEISVDCS